MLKGVFLDRDSMDSGDLDFGPIDSVLSQWQYYNETSQDHVLERIRGVDVVVANKVCINASHFEKSDQLKLICVAATGTNNIDLGAAKKNGTTVCNVTGYATPSVVQHVFSLILALTTRYNEYQQAVKNGEWVRSKHFCLLNYPIAELAGKTMGIIGYGVLGKAVAEIAKAFGMSILVARRSNSALQSQDVSRVDLSYLLTNSDVVSIHCPLTPETIGLIGESELKRMKPSAFLINTARGGIVDEQALVSAIVNREIAGAGFDVLAMEPPEPENHLLKLDDPSLIITPHIAWASQESRQRLLDEIVINIKAYLAGKPRNVVA